ncbi:hypothetical protein [Aeoliella sp.]|uniref:hypothetical protein n=1 Tax=Aeoliella sp. TaxID=2795800 RepID=UPI003CCBCF61
MNRIAMCVAVACLAVATNGATQAATITLNLDSLDVLYAGGASFEGKQGILHDMNTVSSAEGGNEDPVEAHKLVGGSFKLDETLVEQYMESDNIYGDLLIFDLGSSIASPSPVSFATGDNSVGMDDYNFGFDWFQKSGGVTTSSLSLKFDDSLVVLTDTGSQGNPTLLISASTTEWSQFNLPGGLQFAPGSEISFSFTTTSNNTRGVPQQGDFENIIAMNGVLTISGQAIPEPTGAYLLLTGLGVAVVAVRWRLG